MSRYTYRDFRQTYSAIPASADGADGGALRDARGRVIGLQVTTYTRTPKDGSTGTRYVLHVHQTRNGRTYGASPRRDAYDSAGARDAALSRLLARRAAAARRAARRRATKAAIPQRERDQQ